MNWWRKSRLRLLSLFARRRLDAEMDDEMRSHVELQTQANLEAGQSLEEARHAALRQFGHSDGIKETCRDQREGFVSRQWSAICRDVRFAIRQLSKSPGFTAVAVLTLALGIGATTAIFTVINTLLLRALPVPRPQELVQASVVGGNSRDVSFSFPGYERLQHPGGSLAGVFAAGTVNSAQMVAASEGATEPEIIRSQPVTGNFFQVLELQPFLGRLLDSNDDQRGRAEPVVVMSHAFWTRRFQGNPSIIGQTIAFNDVPVTVLGVAPPGFFGFQPGENPDLWWPLQLVRRVNQDPEGRALGEGNQSLRVIGRLARNTDLRQAQAQLAATYQLYLAERAGAMGSKLTTQERESFSRQKLDLQPAGTGWTELRGRLRQPLLILSVVVAVVLIIACANVASLMLARSVARAREFSIRAALGAQRFRLIRQLLTESVLLAGLGGLAGLLLANWGAQLLVSQVGIRPDPISFNFGVDARVLGFALAVSLITGLAFGLMPALRGGKADLASAMKGSGKIAGISSRPFLQQSLVVVQVALSLMLLVGAGLFVRTLQELKGMDMGFTRENVVLVNVGFAQRMDPLRRAQIYQQLLARTEEMPGVRAASLSVITPLTDNSWGQRLIIEGYTPSPEEVVRGNGMAVAHGYFETMGTPLLSGRDFTHRDERLEVAVATNAPGVAIINEALARSYFGEASPLGKRFSFFGNPSRKFEIVGVVKDAKYRSLRAPAPPTFYVSCFQEMRNRDATLAVRLEAQPTGVIENLRRTIRETDPALYVNAFKSMEDIVNASVQQERLIANLGSFFSLSALALACLGLYGTLSFTVAQRTREIGVRMALGAQRRDVLTFVVAKGMKLAAIGLALGLTAAFAETRLVTGLLYGVNPTDPATFLGVSVLLLLIALLASWLPARRATRVNPIEALRAE